MTEYLARVGDRFMIVRPAAEFFEGEWMLCWCDDHGRIVSAGKVDWVHPLSDIEEMIHNRHRATNAEKKPEGY